MNSTTALAVWKTFKDLYEDKGLTRKIGLLRSLINTKLSESDNMQNYLDTLLDHFNKIAAIGFTMTDDWKTAIVLAGLGSEFKPFIMSIEASEKQPTADQK